MESPIQELLRKAADAKKFPTQANPVDDLARKLHATNRMPYYCTRCGTWHRITEGCGWLRACCRATRSWIACGGRCPPWCGGS